MTMPAYAPAYAAADPAAQFRPAAERLRLLLLWLTGAAGAAAFIEPSPYEFASMLALLVFVVGGLTVRAAFMPLAVLLILLNVGFSYSASTLLNQQPILIWVLTSWYLAVTALFFAMALTVNTEARLNALMRGCVIAGVITSVAGVAGYFHLLPRSDDLFLLYGRAKGTFKDPNVFGAFLILPALLALQQVIFGQAWRAIRNMVLFGLFSAAILLSFSRGAWGQAALLSIPAVAELFKERVSLEQSYDVGETGRFGRHVLGAMLALDTPFGIGPMQFHNYFPEDPHNTYLNAFMSGGWLSGVCAATLVLLTLSFGFRAVFVTTPWQPTLIAVYSAYVGLAVESAIIDTDHWRHSFLLLGVLWGLIAATRTYDPSSQALVRRRVAA